eukprot:scaffold24759_cov112-Isochrysis_galbana.AAC.2
MPTTVESAEEVAPRGLSVKFTMGLSVCSFTMGICVKFTTGILCEVHEGDLCAVHDGGLCDIHDGGSVCRFRGREASLCIGSAAAAACSSLEPVSPARACNAAPTSLAACSFPLHMYICIPGAYAGGSAADGMGVPRAFFSLETLRDRGVYGTGAGLVPLAACMLALAAWSGPCVRCEWCVRFEARGTCHGHTAHAQSGAGQPQKKNRVAWRVTMAPRQLRLEPIEVDMTAEKGPKRVRPDSNDESTIQVRLRVQVTVPEALTTWQCLGGHTHTAGRHCLTTCQSSGSST